MLLGGLTAEEIATFFAERQQGGHRWRITPGVAGPLLGNLGAAGVALIAHNRCPRGHRRGRRSLPPRLVDKRGLAAETVTRYELAARAFVSAVGGDVEALRSLTAGDVSRFGPGRAPTGCPPRELVSSLRSFLRFLLAEGVTGRPLGCRSFTPEFKADIVERCRRSGRTVSQVARDFDLTKTAVREWVRQAEVDAGRRDGLSTEERNELSQLRRENRRLREDVDILKRATASM